MATDTRTHGQRYGRRHQDARQRFLDKFNDGDLCNRCLQPMHSWQPLALDHDDDDPTRYRGLAHASCNNAAGGSIGGATTAARYFGKASGPQSNGIPTTPYVACTRCTDPHCWRGVGWSSRCWVS